MFSDKLYYPDKHQYTIAMLAYDEPGVLARITGLFMKRGFNISTLTAGPSTLKDISRITISFIGDDMVYEQLVKQLNKLIDVVKVSDLPEKKSVIRELALVKVASKKVTDQNQLMNYCQVFRARVVNTTRDDMTIEIIGKPQKIDAFLKLAKSFGIKEIARTGVTALSRGASGFEEME